MGGKQLNTKESLMKNSSKVGLTLGAAVLTLGGVAGVTSLAQAADPSASPTPSTTAGGLSASISTRWSSGTVSPGSNGSETAAGRVATPRDYVQPVASQTRQELIATRSVSEVVNGR